MPLEFVRNDITRMQVDAIVNAANETLLGGGGVDGAIHRAAGPGLLEECRALGGCPTGEARLTRGYDLPCRYVIHTVGPIWQGGEHGEEALLRACYENALALAKAHSCRTLAFPLISAGVYGYPRAEALRVATDAIRAFLLDNDMLVYMVIFDRKSLLISDRLYANIARYIDDNYVDEHYDEPDEAMRGRRLEQAKHFNAPSGQPPEEAQPLPKASKPDVPSPKASAAKSFGLPHLGISFRRKKRKPEAAEDFTSPAESPSPWLEGESSVPLPTQMEETPSTQGRPIESDGPSLWDSFGGQTASLDELLRQVDESFSRMVLRKIDERGITDAACYKKANIDRKLFSKLRSDPDYRPSKRTALALGIALELPLPELREMLMKAGFALSHASRFDIIVEYFVSNHQYDIDQINETLFTFDQPTLC